MTHGRDSDLFISELIELLNIQEKEIKRLKQTIYRINQYIEVYEDYIKGE